MIYDKIFKAGLVVGRFQPIHHTHAQMIQASLDLCDQVVLLVGSAQEHHTERNPFPVGLRMEMITTVFPTERLIVRPLTDLSHENDITEEWGAYVLREAHQHVDNPIDFMAYGNDENRRGWFNAESIKDMTTLIIPRHEGTQSATKVRELICQNKFWLWLGEVPYPIRGYYTQLRRILSTIDYYKERYDLGTASIQDPISE